RHTRWPRDWSSDVCSSDLELQRVIEQRGRIDEGIAMHAAVAKEFRVFQTRDHPEYPFLCAIAELRLKPDQVVAGAVPVLHPQLHDGVGPGAGLRIDQTHRLQRTEHDGATASLGHHLNRHTPFEVAEPFEVLRDHLLSR